jgi:hypothetical protein
MVDRSSISQGVFIGLESTPGVAVPATKKFGALGITPAASIEVNQFAPMGTKYTTVAAVGKDFATASLAGQATYTELVYPLASVLCLPVITTPGGGSLSRNFLFEPAASAADTVATFTVEQGDPLTRAQRFSNAIVNDFTLNFDRSKTDLGGSMFGTALVDGITLSGSEVQRVTITGTPTGGTFTLTFGGQTTATIAYNATASAVQTALAALSTIGTGNVSCAGGPLPGTPVDVTFTGTLAQQNVASLTATGTGLTGGTSPAVAISTTTAGAAPTQLDLIPVLGSQGNVYVDTTAAALGTTKLTRAFKGSLHIGNRFGTVWPINSANTSYAAVVETKPTLEMKLTVEADSQGMGFLPLLRAGSNTFIRVEFTGPIIEGVLPYLLRIDLAAKVTAMGNYSDEGGVYATEFTLTGTPDPTWNKTLSVLVRNQQTAL